MRQTLMLLTLVTFALALGIGVRVVSADRTPPEEAAALAPPAGALSSVHLVSSHTDSLPVGVSATRLSVDSPGAALDTVMGLLPEGTAVTASVVRPITLESHAEWQGVAYNWEWMADHGRYPDDPLWIVGFLVEGGITPSEVEPAFPDSVRVRPGAWVAIRAADGRPVAFGMFAKDAHQYDEIEAMPEEPAP